MSEHPEVTAALTVKEQAVADMLAKRAVSDRLQPVLDGRAANRVPAVSHEEDGAEDAPTETGTIRRYTAWSLPRGNVVIEMPSRLVEASFDSFEEAQTHADQLNTWLARRPAQDARYRRYVLPAEPTEAQLVEMLDRLAELDRYPAAAFKAVDAAVTAALEDAEAADRVAAAQRAETWQSGAEEAADDEEGGASGSAD